MAEGIIIDDETGILLLDDHFKVGLGELVRYKFSVSKKILDSQNINVTELYLSFKNMESGLLRPIYLTGPYSFYIDIRPFNYNELKKFEGEDLQFCEDVKPWEEYRAVLRINENSRVGDSDEYVWLIDVLSQLSVTALPTLSFRLCIGTKASREMPNGQKVVMAAGISCAKWDTRTLWNLDPPFPERESHLVFLTHGIFSNAGCDMLYLKDKIEMAAASLPDSENPNLLVRGFMQNIGRSSKGVRTLGTRLAKYIIETVDELRSRFKITKISFIGHSLGGLVQAMAVHYIAVKRPDIFDKQTGLEPVNFITLATPYLGVTGETPKFISLALDIGALGQTGIDLALQRTFFLHSDGLVATEHKPCFNTKGKALLELIPMDPALSIFSRFKNRTAYANVLHDGIVPLRTSALLYLDWRGLGEVRGARTKEHGNDPGRSDAGSSRKDKAAGEIPQETMDKKSALQYILPQALIKKNKYKRYKRTQIVKSNSKLNASDGATEEMETEEDFTPPPKASAFESAANVLLAPLPSQEYLKDPSKRQDKIIHDKVYTPDELPPAHYSKRPVIKKLMYPNDRIHRVQERIARKWQETMTWRKVLVTLQPDSHNNIVVRRRFVNSFGWVVVDHLARSHFGKSSS
ncbi:LAMI_0G11166g1_1 [Lachancea mirantina]|uniref:LAMI_0G11166g1_1 n=1 Tax=Lachancea mirantina TaxID=1230905 RepID=A0A1G4KAV5_9SACH|nr:LAMI_0G11166g1_1 [Lachancea mirantina]